MNRKLEATSLNTKQRILDAAECLFARDGYRGTSLRAITGMAAVNLAAVNYHFGSKKALLEEVIRRRIHPLNQMRRKRIEEVRERARVKGHRPRIREVLHAFIEPTIQFRESQPGAEDFITFIGRSLTDPDDSVRSTFLPFIRPMFQLLSDVAGEALPGLSREVIFWRLQFTLGALFHTMHVCSSLDMKPFNISTKTDTSSLINMIIPYVKAGMEAP